MLSNLDTAIFKYKNPIIIHNCFQAMGHGEHSCVSEFLSNGFLNNPISAEEFQSILRLIYLAPQMLEMLII